MNDKKRTVIVHYHIYKNSGTSFDHVLAHSFGDRHLSFDGPFPFFRVTQTELNRIINVKPHVVAFSSHQTILPQPQSLDYRALAAVFLRHPVLRVGSIYRFKRKSKDGTTTSSAAGEMSFADWIEYCFRVKNETGQISNAQTYRLCTIPDSLPLYKRDGEHVLFDLDTSLRNLRNIELLGRTEFFEDDVARFQSICADYGIELRMPGKLKRNVTREMTGTVDEMVAASLNELPSALADRLLAANQQDLALYEKATQLIERDVRI